MRPDSVLLPKVFPLDSVSPGTLIKKATKPNEANLHLESITSHDYDMDCTVPNNQTIVHVGKTGWFSAVLGRFLGATVSGESKGQLVIQGGTLTTRQLKNILETWNRVCADPNARKWFEGMAAYTKMVYFVTAVEILTDGRCVQIIQSGGGAEGFFTIPLDNLTLGNIHTKAGIDLRKLGIVDLEKVNGILGIEVYKVKLERKKKEQNQDESREKEPSGKREIVGWEHPTKLALVDIRSEGLQRRCAGGGRAQCHTRGSG